MLVLSSAELFIYLLLGGALVVVYTVVQNKMALRRVKPALSPALQASLTTVDAPLTTLETIRVQHERDTMHVVLWTDAHPLDALPFYHEWCEDFGISDTYALAVHPDVVAYMRAYALEHPEEGFTIVAIDTDHPWTLQHLNGMLRVYTIRPVHTATQQYQLLLQPL